jgi:phage terminase small subunit
MHDPATTSDNAFTRILEAALRARGDEGETPPAGHHRASDPQVQQAIDDLLSSPAFVPVEKLAQVYSEDRPAEAPPRDLYEFIGDELQLNPDLTVEELKRLRREFAASNHPDRVDPSERQRATRRMTLVNVLIDKALKERMSERMASKRTRK